jgi:deoxyhypusine monooxygenase
MSSISIPAEALKKLGDLVADDTRPMALRMRAVFTLKAVSGDGAVAELCRGFSSASELLKHEVAYVLGQMRCESAVPVLTRVLSDPAESVIARHEAGEALGSLGSQTAVPVLLAHCTPETPVEVRETCELAVARLRWEANLEAEQAKEYCTVMSVYGSVDPAPALTEVPLPELKARLLDRSRSLFDRYKAMFALRNLNSKDSVEALCEGLADPSALYRHEVAFCLGQMQNPHSVDHLISLLGRHESEHRMVLHEAIESLGSLGGDKVKEVLSKFAQDKERIVRESAEVALDIADYNDSEAFQYGGIQELMSVH